MEFKICKKCDEEKDVKDFHFRKDFNRYRNECKLCQKLARNPLTEEAQIRRKMKRNEWLIKNRDLINKLKRDRRKNDPLYAMKGSLSALLIIAFKNKNYKKNTKTIETLGCDMYFFKSYIEERFEPWMNWDNRGKYNGEFNYGWDIDHIIPLCTANTEDEIIKLSHYTNLQPLCSKINRDIKRDIVDYKKIY
jgi:hypothetical protein